MAPSRDVHARARRPQATLSFDVCKRNVLGKLDKSPKGSIDAPIVALVHKINAHADFVTTSTCSGRISLFAHSATAAAAETPGRWLFVSHALVELKEIHAALEADVLEKMAIDGLGEVMLKVEPAILHVQCRTLDDATELLRIATAYGFRESGIVLSSSQKVMLAVRTTSNMMEVPLVRGGKFSNESATYLSDLVEAANKRLGANLRALTRFECAFSTELRLIAENSGLALPISKKVSTGGLGEGLACEQNSSWLCIRVATRAWWLANQLLLVWRCALVAHVRGATAIVVDAKKLSCQALVAAASGSLTGS